MRSINVERSMPVSRSAVWAVLADFPNIAQWNTGVTKSFSTSEEIEGPGATRHCDLAPTGTLEETVVGWEPNDKLVVRIDSTTRLPIQTGEVTFSLSGEGDQTTTGVDYVYHTKWGMLGRLMGPMLDNQLRRGFNGFLADLEKAALSG